MTSPVGSPSLHEARRVGLYEGFACPAVGASDAVIEFLLIEYARRLYQRFETAHLAQIEAASAGLAGTMRDALARRLSFDTVWNLGLGQLRAALRPGQERQCLQAAAQFALDCQAAGAPGTWSARFGRRTQLRWANWSFPEMESLSIVSGGTRAMFEIEAEGATRSITFDWIDGSWRCDAAVELPSLRAGGRDLAVLMPWALTCATNDDIRARLVDNLSSQAIIRTLEGATRLLEEQAPDYAGWTAKVIRSIIPLAAPPDMHLSGSYPDRPGTITCSFPSPPDTVAEILVHEASHQYFHILGRLGPLENGSDERLYYSPVRRQPRPLIYILLAHHAVGNMLLLQRERRNSGVADMGIQERERELRAWFDVLESPLHQSRGLTALGAAIWRPLSDRVRAVSGA